MYCTSTVHRQVYPLSNEGNSFLYMQQQQEEEQQQHNKHACFDTTYPQNQTPQYAWPDTPFTRPKNPCSMAQRAETSRSCDLGTTKTFRLAERLSPRTRRDGLASGPTTRGYAEISNFAAGAKVGNLALPARFVLYEVSKISAFTIVWLVRERECKPWGIERVRESKP